MPLEWRMHGEAAAAANCQRSPGWACCWRWQRATCWKGANCTHKNAMVDSLSGCKLKQLPDIHEAHYAKVALWPAFCSYRAQKHLTYAGILVGRPMALWVQRDGITCCKTSNKYLHRNWLHMFLPRLKRVSGPLYLIEPEQFYFIMQLPTALRILCGSDLLCYWRHIFLNHQLRTS